MEKTESTEYKIRRAEEIYNSRRENQFKSRTAKVQINTKKDLKLFKKLCIQVISCLAIYSMFYLVKNNNYIFTEDFINKSNEILSYDIDFRQLYSKYFDLLKNKIINQDEETENKENIENLPEQENTEDNAENNTENNTEENIEETTKDDGIGGAEENKEEKGELSQMEQDAIDIKKSISFIKPIEGTITSTFGMRDPTTSTVPKYHTGLDIANKLGTPIYSSTEGEVVLASSEGDYR